MNQVFSFIILFCFLFSCKQGESLDPKVGSTMPKELIALQEGETIILAINNEQVRLTVESIDDSRCPIEAFCFWAGVNYVTISTDIKGLKKNSIVLCSQCQNYNFSFPPASIKLGTHNLVFVDTIPQNSINYLGKKTAQFQVLAL